ncbi:hypothetical protein A3194_05290 [Candidatus Thiodiazotropha endoloripes]|uniref:hypothetical protein n=1 Tax=Candidatus Thiodiazotropha endoloripes TaxID=1818881 RepID=UPI00083CC068|nr:hypothetical protein [Candidatus Thiodiazotropha endoloripes]ODB94075.1 hypothetical protein A3194_05290 [Candidatus Thiodiazotropha endoloripes]
MTKRNTVDIEHFKNINGFVYSFLTDWKAKCEYLLSNIKQIEQYYAHKTTELYYLDGNTFRVTCIPTNNKYLVGFSISAVLQIYDLFIQVSNSKLCLNCLQFNEDNVSNEHQAFIPFEFDESTIKLFPNVLPTNTINQKIAKNLSFIVLEYMLWHEVTHLWEGHNHYTQWRVDSNKKLSKTEKRALEWEADRLAISRLMLTYRIDERIIPIFELYYQKKGNDADKAIFNTLKSSPRKYIRSSIFSLLIYYWHFNEPINNDYLDSDYPKHAARAFYMIPSLISVLNHSLYQSWGVNEEEFMNDIAIPAVIEAKQCWDEITCTKTATENIVSVFSNRFALHDIKRFEKEISRITSEIKHRL